MVSVTASLTLPLVLVHGEDVPTSGPSSSPPRKIFIRMLSWLCCSIAFLSCHCRRSLKKMDLVQNQKNIVRLKFFICNKILKPVGA